MHFAEIRAFVETVLLKGTDYRLAGGYARDLYHGLEPKDLDYWVRYTDSADSAIRSRLLALGVGYEEYEQYDSNEHDTRKRVAVYKLNCGADIILSNESPEESIAKFDYNLNQFEMLGNTPVFVGEVHPREGLVVVSDDVGQFRRANMRSLWNMLYGEGK